MKTIQILLVTIIVSFSPLPAHASGVPVVDVAAIAQLIKQVQDGLKMIEQLNGVLGHLNELQNFAEIDHINLAPNWNTQWWERYNKILEDVMKTIGDYQGGGAFGQIERIIKDEIYPGYHGGWESGTDFSEEWHNTKKQMLWTKIQLKHAAAVGAELREQMGTAEKGVDDIMSRNMTAVGQLQAVKIGTEMTMNVVKGIQLTNFHLGEFLQAYTAQGLEENSVKGKAANARDAASVGIERITYDSPPAPKSPVK